MKRKFIFWLFITLLLSYLAWTAFPRTGGKGERIGIVKTVETVKQITKAVHTFRLKYNALPGDFKNVEELPGCQLSKCAAGNGDGVIGTPNNLSEIVLFEDERHLFWVHLAKANLLSGQYNPDSKTADWGTTFPASSMGRGGFHIYHHTRNSIPPHKLNTELHASGLYLILSDDLKGVFRNKETNFLTPYEAAHIDAAFDDGLPLTSRVIGVGEDQCFENTYIQRLGQTRVIYKQGDDKKRCLSLYIFIAD